MGTPRSAPRFLGIASFAVLIQGGLALHACALRPAAQSTASKTTRLCQHLLHLSETDDDDDSANLGDGDWREMRARLVAQEKLAESGDETEDTSASGDGYVYESPLIEQGSVIMGGTEQEFGFALRQQYFHKCVMLLLSHDEGFTKGIIINRPSAYMIDGWRVWFGGDVAEGAMFRGEKEAKGEREIICLHTLESETAERLSMPVIKGVSCARSALATRALLPARRDARARTPP